MAPRKRKREPGASSTKPGEVFCDLCSEPRQKALKSCLVCLCSFCETHLQPHITVAGLQTHPLTDPVDNLEDRMCTKHKRPLELFCKQDQCGVCTMCVLLDHKNHELVPQEESCANCESSLRRLQTRNENLLQQRGKKVVDIQQCVELSEVQFDRERAAGLQAFTAIMQSVQSGLDQFLEEMQEKQCRSHKQGHELLKQLEQEMCELEKNSADSEALTHSQYPIQFLHRCPELKSPSDLKDWDGVSFKADSCEGIAARSLYEVHKSLSELFAQQFQAELSRVKQFAVDVTLDPETAHPKLVISEDLKQVHHSDQMRALPENPRRFSQCCCVLGQEKVSSGKFYFEVQVGGKSEWDLGVVRESMSTKGKIALKPTNGQWVIWLRSGHEYRALAGRSVILSPRRPPQKIGVFVDYDEGLVSFYDADSADLLYSFTGCSFEESLRPFLSPCNNDKGKNSTPLVLTPVCNTEPMKSEAEEQCIQADQMDQQTV